MAQPVFNAQFIPRNSLAVASNRYDVTASVIDFAGIFRGQDVSVDDVVILDTTPSTTSPGSISRYRVIQVFFASADSVVVRIEYEDVGTPVNPVEVINIPGYISRRTRTLGYAYHASPDVQNIPEYLVTYARNLESDEISDTVTTGSFSGSFTGIFFGVVGSASVESASYAGYAAGAGFAGTATTASYAITSSYAQTAQSSSYAEFAKLTPLQEKKFTIYNSDQSITVLNEQPSGIADYSDGIYTKLDLSNYTQVRCSSTVVDPGIASSRVVIQYAFSPTASWQYLDGVGGPECSLAVSGSSIGEWVTLASESKADVYIRWASLNGNGIVSPSIRTIILGAR